MTFDAAPARSEFDDFVALLEASFSEEAHERGDLVTGVVVAQDPQGLIVAIDGMKRDGIVQRRDLERMGADVSRYPIGSEMDVMIIRMEDDDGNLILSASQAQQTEDWKKAEAMLESGEVWDGEVADANRGGVIVQFGNLRGFVPASHVLDLPRGLNEDERKLRMQRMIGETINLKVIEVNRKRRRLVFSQRDASRGSREQRKELLLDQLNEGEVRSGVVSGLRDFGAFVDLGGADGLIHISELAWHRVNHPKEILKVGDEIDVFVLRLDSEGKRIGLSLKRLQDNPWALVDELYHIGQLVEGVVSRVAQFGAFISLDPGIEALLHTSQISDPPPEDPTLVVHEGQHLLLRVISIETEKQRLGLSLKDVTEGQKSEWMLNKAEEAEAAAEEDADADDAADIKAVVAEAEEVVAAVEIEEVIVDGEVVEEEVVEEEIIDETVMIAVPEDDNTL